MIVKARHKARERADSIAAAEDKQKQLSHLAEVRTTRMKQSIQRQRERRLKQQQRQQLQSEKTLITLYTLLEERRADEAYRIFSDREAMLKESLSEADFDSVTVKIFRATRNEK
jgi:hypothetical protein